MELPESAVRWVVGIASLISLSLAVGQVVVATDPMDLIRFLALTTVCIFLLLIYVIAVIQDKH